MIKQRMAECCAGAMMLQKGGVNYKAGH